MNWWETARVAMRSGPGRRPSIPATRGEVGRTGAGGTTESRVVHSMHSGTMPPSVAPVHTAVSAL